MESAKDIRKKIADDAAAVKLPSSSTAGVGIVISHPGTEKVMFDATTFQLMECDGRVKDKDKRRYCFVEKGVKAQYALQFTNAMGDRAHIITHELYVLLIGIFNNVMKQLRELDSKATLMEEKANMFKLTIDALRKNGVID